MTKIVNIEIKARSSRINKVRDFLNNHAASFKGVDYQEDTYFKTNEGRLKIREGRIENSLIFYLRKNNIGPKMSDVILVKKPGPELKELLTKSNGILAVVKKKREIYFIDNVKFHLDEVDGLGSFVEIEAISEEGQYTQNFLQKQCEKYLECFEISPFDLIDCSYSDFLIEAKSNINAEIGAYFSHFLNSLSECKDLLGHFQIYEADHVCFRVETEQQYDEFTQKFSIIGNALISSEVGGRQITSFKLHEPLVFQNKKIWIVELPAPKVHSPYQLGFEHIEFLISESFPDFIKRFNSIDFDLSGVTKKHNPELRVKLPGNLSLKFHHHSLEELIMREISAS
jgi:predicted adenylyl cyclase CyaB